MQADVIEFRVRPVERFNLTQFTRNANGSSSHTVCELPSMDAAMDVVTKLVAATPGAVLVDRTGRPMTLTPTSFSVRSRFRPGDRVMRVAIDNGTTGHAAEEAEVYGVHFTQDRVIYDVTFPSGRAAETGVNSLDLQDLPPLETVA